MIGNKPRVVKDYEKLDSEIQEQIKLCYPDGFSDNLVHYSDKDGKQRTALPFEAEDKYYLVRMTIIEAEEIIRDDDDYDDDGLLRDDLKEKYEEKYQDDDLNIDDVDDVEDVVDAPMDDDDFDDED